MPNSTSLQADLVMAGVYSIVLVVGFSLNAASVLVLLHRHGLKSPMAILMTNLATSDLLLAFSLPLRIYYHATASWPFGSMLCVWVTILFRNNLRLSAIFITFISLDRLLAVVFPLRSRHLWTTGWAWRACGLVWVIIIILSVPESIYLAQYLRASNESLCFGGNFREQDSQSKGYALAQTLLIFFLLAINFVSTAMVIRVLCRRPSGTGAGVVTARERRNVAMIFVMNLLVFAVFFLPFTIVVLMSAWEAIPATVCLASINCCVDPLVYYFSMDAVFREKHKNSGNNTTSTQNDGSPDRRRI